jgi:hypothetical protein
VLAAVAIAGGGTLSFHFHDGRLRLDSIYLQHALMARRWWAWAWPAFLAAMATVLLFCREGSAQQAYGSPGTQKGS